MEKQPQHHHASEVHLQVVNETEDKHSNAQLWEENSEKIADAVEFLVKSNLKVNVTNVARHSNLSPPTIYNHLDSMGNKVDDNGEKVSYPRKLIMLMDDRVLEKVCAKALEGDHPSAKLFEAIKQHKKVQITNNYVSNHYNSIIFKGITITEKALEALPPEIQTTIITLLKSASEKEIENGTENAQ